MKRMATLTLVALACLTTMPAIAQGRYRDGMNLYEYVRSEPVGRLDPTGQFEVLTNNEDVKAAYNQMISTNPGKELVECIKGLEVAGSRKVSVIVMLATKVDEQSRVVGISTQTRPIFVADKSKNKKTYRFAIEVGNKQQMIGFTITPFKANRKYIGQEGIQVRLNPLYALTQAAKNTGSGPTQFTLGARLDVRLFHELQHAKQLLLGKNNTKPSPGTLVTEDNMVLEEDAELRDLKTMTEEDRQAWYERWSNPAEYEAIKETNQKYRRELKLKDRWGHKLTKGKKGKKGQAELLAELLARGNKGGLEYEHPLLDYPAFPLTEDRKRYYVKNMFKKGNPKHNAIVWDHLKKGTELKWMPGVDVESRW